MLQELFGVYTVESGGTEVGQLTVSAQGLMTRFTCECVVATAEIMRLAVLCGDRYVLLGVLLPDGDRLRFIKSYSKNDLRQKGITAIDACRLVSRHDTLTVDPPNPMAEPNAEAVPIAETEEVVVPQAEAVSVEMPESSTPVFAPDSPPDWEVVRELDSEKAIVTHEARITPPEKPIVPDEDLENIDPYPGAVETVKIVLPQKESPIPESTTESPAPAKWTPHPTPGILFTDPDLVAAGTEVTGAMTRPCGDDCIALAVPFEGGKPFPLLPIFCHGQNEEIDGKAYLTFRIRNGNLVK